METARYSVVESLARMQLVHNDTTCVVRCNAVTDTASAPLCARLCNTHRVSGGAVVMGSTLNLSNT